MACVGASFGHLGQPVTWLPCIQPSAKLKRQLRPCFAQMASEESRGRGEGAPDTHAGDACTMAVYDVFVCWYSVYESPHVHRYALYLHTGIGDGATVCRTFAAAARL